MIYYSTRQDRRLTGSTFLTRRIFGHADWSHEGAEPSCRAGVQYRSQGPPFRFLKRLDGLRKGQPFKEAAPARVSHQCRGRKGVCAIAKVWQSTRNKPRTSSHSLLWLNDCIFRLYLFRCLLGYSAADQLHAPSRPAVAGLINEGCVRLRKPSAGF